MRRLACALILISTLIVWGCGGGSAPNNTPQPSFQKRAFVSNNFSNAVDIVNASTDAIGTSRVLTDNGPKVMTMSPDKTITLVSASFGGFNSLDAISNQSQIILGTLSLSDETISFLYQPDNKIIYIAVRNAGQVIRWDTSTATNPTSTILVPNVLRIVRSNDGKSILAFPDDASNSVYHIDTTVTPHTVTQVAGFDRPVWAVFSSDGSKAWVLNCGPECGGTTAGVQVLNLPALTLGASAAVPGGATYALLSGSTLFVAGTPPSNPCTFNAAVNCGFLTKVDVSGAPSAGASYEINDGYHDHMLLAPNNRLFIGAQATCAALPPNGCLSIFNTSNSTAKIIPPCGSACNSLNDITGMTTISGRNVVYVVEGGELRIYDTATDALQSKQVDTVGRSWDVVSPD